MIKAHHTEYRILIEGHADKNESLIAGNMNHWSLSAARAAQVIARFEYFGFKTEYLVALAKGDREPVAEYKMEAKNGVSPREIAKLNRRAVIRVLEPIAKHNGKIRAGALFQDGEGADNSADAYIFKQDQ